MPYSLLSNNAPLSLTEFVMRESIPLSTIHHIVLSYLTGRTDVVIFGAQAVNAYVDDFRMTQDVDLMALHAESLATAIRDHLHQELSIATRVRTVANGKGFRVYQVQKPANRHLVDLRQVDTLPSCQINDGIQVVAPVELIALKIIAMTARRQTPKGLTDHADLMRLLLKYPTYKTSPDVVAALLEKHTGDPQPKQLWQEIASQDFHANNDEEY